MAATIDGTTGLTAPSGAIFNGIASGTAVASTSGTSIDFTSIPSWVKRITVMLSGVSTSGSSDYLVQIGAGSIANTGYLGSSSRVVSAVISANYTTGFGINNGTQNSSYIMHGNMVIFLQGSNIWTASGTFADSSSANTTLMGSSKSLGGTLDRIRITTVNGTDTFDAGSINILYE